MCRPFAHTKPKSRPAFSWSSWHQHALPNSTQRSNEQCHQTTTDGWPHFLFRFYRGSPIQTDCGKVVHDNVVSCLAPLLSVSVILKRRVRPTMQMPTQDRKIKPAKEVIEGFVVRKPVERKTTASGFKQINIVCGVSSSERSQESNNVDPSDAKHEGQRMPSGEFCFALIHIN